MIVGIVEAVDEALFSHVSAFGGFDRKPTGTDRPPSIYFAVSLAEGAASHCR
jgi:hypothetical protein